MEDWATVAIVLGSNFFIAGVTYLITRYQVNSSNKRFEKELERAREVDRRERRREVRSGPLLKLRAELAVMASKQGILLSALREQHTRLLITDEEAKKLYKQAVQDWNSYVSSGMWSQALYSLDDKEIMDKVQELKEEYDKAYVSAMYFTELSAKEMTEAMGIFERSRERIIEIQSMINERLEKL